MRDVPRGLGAMWRARDASSVDGGRLVGAQMSERAGVLSEGRSDRPFRVFGVILRSCSGMCASLAWPGRVSTTPRRVESALESAYSAKGLTDALSCSSAWSYCFPTIDSLNAAPTMSMQAREHVRWTSRPISRASSNQLSFKNIHSTKTSCASKHISFEPEPSSCTITISVLAI